MLCEVCHYVKKPQESLEQLENKGSKLETTISFSKSLTHEDPSLEGQIQYCHSSTNLIILHHPRLLPILPIPSLDRIRTKIIQEPYILAFLPLRFLLLFWGYLEKQGRTALSINLHFSLGDLSGCDFSPLVRFIATPYILLTG